MVMREIMLNIGRILSIITFIVLDLFAQEWTYYYLLFAIFVQGLLFKIISTEKIGFIVRKDVKIKPEM
jgi:MFS transporter, YQGE family, putative transporter